MLQAYSSNLEIAANTAYTFNNVTIDKGCAEHLSGPSSIQLDKQGVYLVEVDGFGTGAAAGTGSTQLYVNGVAQLQAISSYNTAANSISNFSFKTFVQVATNNCPCNCISSPTVLQVMNGEENLTEAHINIVVTKIR